jgi:hypothetical protein
MRYVALHVHLPEELFLFDFLWMTSFFFSQHLYQCFFMSL